QSAREIGAKHWLPAALRGMGDVLHQRGDRDEAWRYFAEALDAEGPGQNPGSRVATLSRMGLAALREQDYGRAVSLLDEAAGVGDSIRRSDESSVLLLSRLARAHAGAGDEDRARERAAEARKLLDSGAALSPEHQPEIFFNLRVASGSGEAAAEYVTSACDLIEALSRAISNDAQREHFLQKTWPNPEILSEARRLRKR
ncbi:MAG: hypothetical protein ACYTGV_13110, partial [Planctomycetota bacterium]